MSKNDMNNRKLKFTKKDKIGNYDIDGVSFDGIDVVVGSGPTALSDDSIEDVSNEKTVRDTSQHLDPASHEVGKKLFRHTGSKGYDPDRNKGSRSY